MKLIIRITLALVMLCFACAEIKSPYSISAEASLATATEIVQEATESNTENEEDLNAESAKQTGAATSSKEAPIIERATEQEHASTAQSETISEEITHAKTGGESEIPNVIEHAKTGYDGDEPEPTPQSIPEAGETAGLQTAMDAACAYAVETYGVTIDTTLNFNNSSYRFPAVVPDGVSQETLNAKAIDMVEYTFQQQIALCGITMEDIRNAGIRCNVYCCRENGDILTYIFYDG